MLIISIHLFYLLLYLRKFVRYSLSELQKSTEKLQKSTKSHALFTDNQHYWYQKGVEHGKMYYNVRWFRWY